MIYYNTPGDVKWDEGRVSGAVYHGETDLTGILTKVPETYVKLCFYVAKYLFVNKG